MMALTKGVEYWNKTQQIKEVFMVDDQGLKQGASESFYPEGQLWGRASYKNGKLNGPFIRYYPNGAVLEKGIYLAGWLNGIYEVYDQAGQIIKRENYSHGWLDSFPRHLQNSGR